MVVHVELDQPNGYLVIIVAIKVTPENKSSPKLKKPFFMFVANLVIVLDVEAGCGSETGLMNSLQLVKFQK